VRLGKVFANPGCLPAVHYELPLKDGEILRGNLLSKWNSQKQQWIGYKGLDWHLKIPSNARRNSDQLPGKCRFLIINNYSGPPAVLFGRLFCAKLIKNVGGVAQLVRAAES
jgi:hypothetical protein